MPSAILEGFRNFSKSWWGGCVVAVGLLFLTACEKRKSLEPAPVPASVPSKPKASSSEKGMYRAQGGILLAPAVLTDTPGAEAEARPVARPSIPPSVDTLNGDPKGLKRRDLDRVMSGAMQRMSSCFSPGTPDPKIHLSFEADPSGKTSLLRVKGAPVDAERCIRNIVQEMRVPSFEGSAVPVEMPLVFHEVKYKTEMINAKERQPAVPSLFVQP